MITTSHSAVAPIDYISTSNEFIFLKDDYTLRVNYEAKTFQLNTPDRIAYDEDFEFIQSPPAWFEDKIGDYYIIEWAQSAIKWNDQTIRNSRYIVKTSVEVDEIVYHVEFNTKTNDLSIEIPCKTIISHPNSLYYNFPEFKYLDSGELITLLTAEIFYKTQGLNFKRSDHRKFHAPITFYPKKIRTSISNYQFEYKLEYDLILLEIPTRKLLTNMVTIELGPQELAVMHDGKLIEAIRNVVYEQSLSV